MTRLLETSVELDRVDPMGVAWCGRCFGYLEAARAALLRGRRAARAHSVLATTDLERNLLLETPDEIQRRLLA